MRQILATAMLLVFLGGFPARGEEFRSTPTAVTVFKNGLAWITEEGRGQTDSEWVATTLHAAPVLGTLKVTPRAGFSLLELEAAPPPPDPLATLLQAAQAGWATGPATVVSGGRSLTGRVLGLSHTLLGAQEPALVLQSKEGLFFLPVSKVERVEDDPVALPADPPGPGEALKVKLRLSVKEGAFHVVSSYLTRQIGWLPTYHLDLADSGKGMLAMHAELVNDALDLQSVEVSFATGEAAFPMSATPSPLFSATASTEETMDSIMRMVENGNLTPDAGNNPYYQSNFGNFVPAQQMVRPGGRQGGGPKPAATGEETHLYGPVTLSLAKGRRAMLPLGHKEIPASFVYYYKAPRELQSAPPRNDVWLAARLVNELSFPLTTGPLLVTRKEKPVGQGFVTYTHEGGEAVVPISIASTVLASVVEQEAGRKKGAHTFRGMRWDEVTLKGTIALENLQSKGVTVRVEKPLSGTPGKLSNEGKSQVLFVSAWDPNPQSAATWTVALKPGEKSEITYHYSVFVERSGDEPY